MPPPPKTPLLSTTQPDQERQRTARDCLLTALLDAARDDDRVLAVLDYGSTSEGRGDAWSDIDLAIVIDPDAWEEFRDGWRGWLQRCGHVLLGFIAFPGHPWAVIETSVAPVRVDLHLYGGAPDHGILEALPHWPNSPGSVDAMLLFDRNGALAGEVAKLVGQSLAPADPAETFADVAAHFWYYVHRTWSKLHRDSAWGVRWNLTFIVTGNLCALLRLESGATERWAASDAADGIEAAISAARLEQLDQCIPGPDPDTFVPTLRRCVELGIDVCDSIAAQTDREWSRDLGARMLDLLSARSSSSTHL